MAGRIDAVDQAVFKRQAVDAPEHHRDFGIDQLVADIVDRIVVTEQNQIRGECFDGGHDVARDVRHFATTIPAFSVHPRFFDDRLRARDLVVFD